MTTIQDEKHVVHKAKEHEMDEDSEEEAHKSRHDSNAYRVPERTEEMLAMELASGKVSKMAFFEKFTELWAQRYTPWPNETERNMWLTGCGRMAHQEND
jgi:hypothetical protein